MAHIALQTLYEKEVTKQLAQEFDIKNTMALPKITKVVVNMGTGDSLKIADTREKIMADLAAITGQKPRIQPAKVSIAGFNLREGSPIGLTVTLRGKRMYEFLDKLISVVLPRLRDFRGVSAKSFDGRGNYSIGLSEHTVFPEIDFAKVDRPRGLQITVVTTAKNDEVGRKLLALLGMPFEK